MSEGLKTYEELILIAKENFLPESRHFIAPDHRQAVHTIGLARVLGFQSQKDSSTTDKYDAAVRFLESKGIDGFSPNVAFFGQFDKDSQLRVLPWTDFAVGHAQMIEQLREQVDMTPVYPELLVGYAFRTAEGTVTSMYYGDVFHRNEVAIDKTAINALHTVARSMPRVEHILATSGQYERVGQ